MLQFLELLQLFALNGLNLSIVFLRWSFQEQAAELRGLMLRVLHGCFGFQPMSLATLRQDFRFHVPQGCESSRNQVLGESTLLPLNLSKDCQERGVLMDIIVVLRRSSVLCESLLGTWHDERFSSQKP